MHKIWVNFSGPYISGLADTLGLTEGVYIQHYDSPKAITQIHSLLESFNFSPRGRILDNITRLERVTQSQRTTRIRMVFWA